MEHRVKLPKMGDTVDEVVVIEWEVAPGDAVEVGDPLMRVETDKVEADVPSPVAGTVRELLVAADDEIPTGTVICVLDVTD